MKWVAGLREFVKKNNIEMIDGRLIFYKAVSLSYGPWYYGKDMSKNGSYKPGTLVKNKRGVDTRRGEPCSYGLHITTKEGAYYFGRDWLGKGYVIKVSVKPEDILCVPYEALADYTPEEHEPYFKKVRCRELYVVEQVGEV